MRQRLLSILLLLVVSGPLPAQDILGFHPPEDVVPRLLSARKPSLREDGSPVACSWTLLHCSDLHGCTENLQRIVTFLDKYHSLIDVALHTGDSVKEWVEDGNPWQEVKGAESILNTVGNHDCRKRSGETSSPEETYRLLVAPYVNTWQVVQPEGVNNPSGRHYAAGYYFKDFPVPGIRLVVLDGNRYTPEQHTWFESVLDEAREHGLQVVAVNHFSAQNGLIPIESGFSERGVAIEPKEETSGRPLHRLDDRAYRLVDRFLDKGGTFICWLSGHEHQDFVGHVRDHGRQFQVTVDKSGWSDWFMEEDRTPGTPNQDSFNLLTVNVSRNLLILDRIGCVRDQYMRGKHLFVYDYRKREVLVNE